MNTEYDNEQVSGKNFLSTWDAKFVDQLEVPWRRNANISSPKTRRAALVNPSLCEFFGTYASFGKRGLSLGREAISTTRRSTISS